METISLESLGAFSTLHTRSRLSLPRSVPPSHFGAFALTTMQNAKGVAFQPAFSLGFTDKALFCSTLEHNRAQVRVMTPQICKARWYLVGFLWETEYEALPYCGGKGTGSQQLLMFSSVHRHRCVFHWVRFCFEGCACPSTIFHTRDFWSVLGAITGPFIHVNTCQ